MAVTTEFMDAVQSNNILRVRIMLKDSLLVDKGFGQFEDMCLYAQRRGVDFWASDGNEVERLPREDWNQEVMDLELTRLVNDFSRSRLAYCKSIISWLYRRDATAYGQYRGQESRESGTGGYAGSGKAAGAKASPDSGGYAHQKYYTDILKGVTKMNRILRDNKTATGRNWTYGDIDDLQAQAEKIYRACAGIKNGRRG